MLALFAINIVFIISGAILQSCTNDDLMESNIFDEKVKYSLNKISNISIVNRNINLSKNSNELTEIFLLKNSFTDINLTKNEVSSFDDLLHVSREEGVLISDKNYKDYEVVDSYLIDERLIKDSFKPAVSEAKNIINSYGVSETEIQQILNETGATEEHLVPVIMMFNSVNNNSSIALNNSVNLFITNSYAQGFDSDKALDCAIAAVGLNLFDIARNITETGFKTALKAALRGVATKFLGPIGIAITVAEWAWCYSH